MEKSQKGNEPIVSPKETNLLLLLLFWKGEWKMYNNPYANINLNERIDNEIEKLKQMKANMQQPTPITQNFQLAPTHSGIKYANTIDDVKKEVVYFDTPFFSKDLSVLWVKNSKGEIKAYELKEIVQKDEKDIQIEYLMGEIDKLKGMIENEHNANANREVISTSTSNGNETIREQVEDDEPTSIQRISRSKTK